MLSVKTCSKCKEEKPTSMFVPDKGKNDGLFPHCKPCKKLYDEAREDVRRDGQYQKKYGISLAQYNTRLSQQGGTCAICKNTCTTQRYLAVDHCHTTGAVRGLLCTRCNRGMGMLRDNVEVLKSAIEYLQQSR